MKMISGNKQPIEYKPAKLKETVGKTIEGIGYTNVEGEFEPETCYTLLFTDGTKHSFQVPS